MSARADCHDVGDEMPGRIIGQRTGREECRKHDARWYGD